MCVLDKATYRARNRFPEAHTELMTEDVQQEAFTSLQRGGKMINCLVLIMKRPLRVCGGCTDPLVLSSQALLSTDFPAVVTVLYFGVGETPTKRAEKVTPEGGKKQTKGKTHR